MPPADDQASTGKRTPLVAATAQKRTPAFKPVGPGHTFEEVTTQLRELLLGGSLQPGSRLPAERDLAKQLGVGRPVLREALRALEASGLIELRKGRLGGAFISEAEPTIVSRRMADMLRLGNVSVEELFEVRLWMETGMVRAACGRRTEDDLQTLRENVRHAEELHLQGRYTERIEANIEFHHLLACATHNPVAELVVHGLSSALQGLISRVGSELPHDTFSYRHDLINALQARDEQAAVLAIRGIIETAERMYLQLAQQTATSANRAPS